jgi:pimeloyl-ACP methyl ester carboxylesterase
MRVLMLVSLLVVCTATSVAFAREAAPKTAGGEAVTDIGTLEGAGYRIDVPANWNRGLVVFFHGYAIDPVTFREGERISPMFDPLLAKGFAVIQSAYSATGWAVEQGSADSERLRAYFVARHGRPKETFVMGMSMGGTLTAMTIETQPQLYDGALALCGAIEPAQRLMQRDFAQRAAFDYYFPDLLGPLVPVAADYRPNAAVVEKIAAALQANPKAAAALRALSGGGDARSLADVIAFVTYDIKEMQQRARGNPFGNADLIYTGTGDDFALNDGVKRYRPEAKALAYLSRWYTPSGKLLKPMLALHDTGDPLVVASDAFEYALIAQRAGHGDRFVQQYVNAEGHCVFTPAQIGRAFDQLLDWTRNGRRPASGRLPD